MFRRNVARCASICVVACSVTPVCAETPEAIAHAYLSTEGYAVTNADAASQTLRATLKPGAAPAVPSAVESALLLLEAQEQPLSRVRYAVRLSDQVVDATRLTFVEVQRYNLGPAIRRDAIDAYGAENVDTPAAFGVGPHVSLRLVAHQSGSDAQTLLGVSRGEISEGDAVAAQCPIRSCLNTSGADDLASWTEAPSPTPAVAPYAATFTYDDNGQSTAEVAPAYQALQLARFAGVATSQVPTNADTPQRSERLLIVIDRNLGQDVMADAILGTGVSDRWVRLSSAVTDGKPVLNYMTANGPLRAP